MSRYRKVNPRVPQSVRRCVFKRDGYRCQNTDCNLLGREVRRPRGGYGHPTEVPGIYLSVDHVIPKSRGGSNNDSNLRTLCTWCNAAKGAA